LQTENNNNISFGTTLDREIYPSHVPPSKLGRGLCPIRGTPNVGPSTYNNEEVRTSDPMTTAEHLLVFVHLEGSTCHKNHINEMVIQTIVITFDIHKQKEYLLLKNYRHCMKSPLRSCRC